MALPDLRFSIRADDAASPAFRQVRDEVGRTRRALRTRLRLSKAPVADNNSAAKGRIAFDARCLQTTAFGQRGIGRFALAALHAVREAAGDENVTLIIDPGLNPLDEDTIGTCTLVSRIPSM